jgi:serine/threonine-protein kinase
VSAEIPTARPGGAPEIPGYSIERVLGRGTSGIVYRARQISVDRLVALKVMHPDMLGNARSVKRLQREARIAAHLAHPNLISAIDMGQSGGTWWFAMELVEGPSLAERLEKGGRLKENDALELFLQLCGALQHASEKGVVHRDIKPANILLERPDFPRLADLGLARIEDDPLLTRTGATLGTPHYVSPEQARDPALADVRSDIWSLGATMYHAVCGQPPFAGSSTAEILSGVLYGPIPDPIELRPELSKGLALVLRKCLSRDPNKRYFAPAELAEDLERVLAHKPPQIRRGALEPLDPSRRESRNVAAGTALIVLVLVLGLLALWRPWGSDEPVREVAGEVDESGPWPPLERLARDLAGGELSLAAAFAELEDLRQRLPAARRGDWEEANADLKRRLREQLDGFRERTSNELYALLDERKFSAAEELLGVTFTARLVDETGFEPGRLPHPHLSSFEFRRARLARELEERRAAALAGAVSRIEAFARKLILGVERNLEQGEWNEERRKLAIDLRSLCEDSESDLRGLDEAELHVALGDVQRELEQRLKRLAQDWVALDRDVLTPEVLRLGLLAQDKLQGGALAGVLEAFEDGFDALLEQHRLTREELMAAPVHGSYDTFLARRSELQDVADELSQRAGMARLEELDREAQALYVARDYLGAVRFWQDYLDDAALAVVGETVTVRLEEAQELAAFLLRAARGVARLAQKPVSFPQRSIMVSGRVELRGEPLERGFRLLTSGGNALVYLLRPVPGAEGELLGVAAVERFATEGADLQADIGLQLQRALFRFREGDFEGADALLGTQALKGGDLILFDLGLRVDRQLGQQQDVDARRRDHAQAEVQRLTGRDAEALDPERRSVEIGRLLRDYADVLGESAPELLRKTRATLDRVLPPSTPADFRAAFRPKEVSFPRFGRVLMRFAFEASEVGTWERGDWYFDGRSAWSATPSVDIDELARRAVPTLRLGDPLMIESGTLEVSLRMHQPKDSPPDLFVISALGFHVAFAGARGVGQPRVLSDSTSLVDVARRVREGDGEVFGGLTPDAEHTILLRLSPGSGKVVVWVDELQVERGHHRPPKSSATSAEISFRSIEPVQVLELTLEGNPR